MSLKCRIWIIKPRGSYRM